MMTSDTATIGGFAIAALVAFAAALRWVWPRLLRFFRSIDAMFETINGRPAEMDRAGREQQPAIPSLSVQLTDLKNAVRDQATQNKRITAVEDLAAQQARILAEHGERLTAVESRNQIERSLGHVAQAKVFDAIGEVAKTSRGPDHDDAD
jgi:hypothetical protein